MSLVLTFIFSPVETASRILLYKGGFFKRQKGSSLFVKNFLHWGQMFAWGGGGGGAKQFVKKKNFFF